MRVASGKAQVRIRPRRFVLAFTFVALATLVVGALGVLGAENQDDPRNLSYGKTYQGNPSTDCWAHHRGEGMRDSHAVIPIFPKQIRVGEVTNLQVQVENSWKYDLAEITVDLNLLGSGPENKTIIASQIGSAGEAVPPVENTWTGAVWNPAPNDPAVPVDVPVYQDLPSVAWGNFTVGPDPLALFANVEIYIPEAYQDPPASLENRFRVELFRPQTSGILMQPTDETATSRSYSLPTTASDGSDITLFSGDHSIRVEYLSGSAPSVDYAINITVLYKQAGANQLRVYEQLRTPADPEIEPPESLVPPRGVSEVINIPVLGFEPGEQLVEVKVTALLYYEHQDGRTPNEDRFERYAVVPVQVGNEFIESDVGIATGGVVEEDFRIVAGEVTGFASAFLLLPSLLLGGTYGKGSRKFFNSVLGGAKRRVMFHNLVSLGLTLLALIHIVFFLLEIRYTVLMGVLFGGLAALSLLVLGLTGYYQVPLIQRYGYSWWRSIHLVVGLAVVAFVAWHSIIDGADFNFIEEQLPPWLAEWNLADK